MMRLLEMSTGKLEDYVGLCRRGSGGALSSSIFRGQRNSEWKLVPALYRSTRIGGTPNEQTYDGAESILIRNFFHKAVAYAPNLERSEVRDRVIAQHYGVPTRLLDWSADPFVALYFALTPLNVSEDAAVYYINTSVEETIDTVDVPTRTLVSKFRPPAIDSRIVAQKSVFTLHSFGSLGSEFEPLDSRDFSVSRQPAGYPHHPFAYGFGKISIPIRVQDSLRSDLFGFGIDSSALFPGLAGIGRAVAEKHSATVLNPLT